jgi:uncharacterized protein YdaU (DUF1376 family)
MSDPWYRRFPDNFLGGINGMTLEEKGAYSVVIDMIYQRGGPISDEPRYIAGICNCSVRKWNAIRARLLQLGKLYEIDGHLMNERAVIELEKAAKVAREHAENGAKGGDKSAEKRAEARKNNALGQAGLKHTRASSTSTPYRKDGATLSDPTEELVRVDRRVYPEIFAACVSLTEPVKDFIEHKSFPADVYAKAVIIAQQQAAMLEVADEGTAH